jgi:hypothetical protein
MRRAVCALGLAAAALALVVALAPEEVEACGGFFSRTSNERRPSLAYEQALVLHDAAHDREHFVREVAFRAGVAPFGFVVPTPGRPEVAKVDKSPFRSLRSSFPFEDPNRSDSARGGGFGSGHGRLGGAPDGVTVLEVSKVGSFTAFVLAADDAKGLAHWLSDNSLVSSPEADAWLTHYVRMRFYYVAMRYDPPKEGVPGQKARSEGLRAETIRISFSTPAPYYPYFEPKPAPSAEADAGSPSPRLLELWLVSSAARAPVAAKTADGSTAWMRPLQGGREYAEPKVTRSSLAGALSESGLDKLIPEGEVVVQTFQDQKTHRRGYGDVLFVPAQKTALDPAKAAALRPLLGILDPTLVPERTP